MSPLVSIITPCFNGERFIGRFLDSVLNQTYDNLELIIINDGSNDKTEEIIDNYRSRLIDRGIKFIYEYQENAGQAAALNRGLKLFSGEYMTWVDSDDELMPEYVSAKIKHFQAHPNSAFCYGKIVYVNENTPRIIEKESGLVEPMDKSYFERLLFDVSSIPFNGYMVRSESLRLVLPSLDIFTGQGGQNAQILLPLAYEYGEPDFVCDSVYKYFIRNDSHSHSQDTTEKFIMQLYNYESILVETLNRIPDSQIESYINRIHLYYARWRFNCSFDSNDPNLIRKQYKELKQDGYASRKDYVHFLKWRIKFIAT